MISGFMQHHVTLDDVTLNVFVGGEGPPLLLLHGFPQTHATWGRVAPELKHRYTCIVPDLRGYGDSSIPASDASHKPYSKRVMAQDCLQLMSHFGYRKFAVLGHDRGARVAYRLALDSTAVTHLGIIEVIPTGDMWQQFDADMSLKAYHWAFLAQPSPLPETLINAHPEFYLHHTLKSWSQSSDLEPFTDSALETYRQQMNDPRRVAAMCEDYRAGATIDRQLDETDRARGVTIKAPVHFVWSESGFPSQTHDPLALWRQWADSVTGQSIQCGHFAMEENPSAVIAAFSSFFDTQADS